MSITIKTIAHKDQRQNQVGDWLYDAGNTLIILVSALGDWRMEFLIVCHELIEVMLCRHAGIGQKQVDRWDGHYERHREKGDVSEAGDAKGSPYVVQHGIASGIERVLAAILGVDWLAYESKCDKLIEKI